MIALIDYDAGNIKSVEKALQLLGEEVVLTRDRDKLLAADRVILPGSWQLWGRDGESEQVWSGSGDP